MMGTVTVLLLLLGLHVAVTERIPTAIRSLAAQGVLLALLPYLASPRPLWRAAGLGLATVAVKSVAIPLILTRAVSRLEIKRETESLVSTKTSVLLTGVLALSAFVACARFGLSGQDQLGAAAGLTLLFSGLLMMTTRVKAITQVIGFVVLENGIFLFGAASGSEFTLPIELGIFLDLFVAVFLMGILMLKIQRTFTHMDVRKIHTLKD
jgi:hydrogenase-4 component E